jgi:hypothetical protein
MTRDLAAYVSQEGLLLAGETSPPEDSDNLAKSPPSPNARAPENGQTVEFDIATGEGEDYEPTPRHEESRHAFGATDRVSREIVARAGRPYVVGFGRVCANAGIARVSEAITPPSQHHQLRPVDQIRRRWSKGDPLRQPPHRGCDLQRAVTRAWLMPRKSSGGLTSNPCALPIG